MITAKQIDNVSVDKLPQLYRYALALDRTKCEDSYYYFFKKAWKILEPETPLDDNWHIKYLCDLLQREVERIIAGEPKSKDIIINIPPRSGKSYIVTVMLTPWVWTKYPHFKVINSSFSGDLSTKLCLDSRRLIECDWYKTLWGDKFKLTTDMNTKSWYENNKRGIRKSTSTGAQVTGTGGDMIIVDDPQDPEKGESETERETVKRYFGKTLYSRLNNQLTGLRIVIQQRLHEDDLTGHLLANDPDKYYHICIPAQLSKDVSPPELRDNYVDGLFCPKRFSDVVLDDAKSPTNLGAYGFSGQMQQKPSPPEGGTFKRYWWRFWVPKGTKEIPIITFKDEFGKIRYPEIVELPTNFEQVIDSWDFALDGKAESDDVAGSKWGKVDANKYLLDAIVDKLNYPDSKKAFKKLYYSHPGTSAELIERAANGPAIKADLKEVIPGIIDIPVGKLSKEDKVKYSDTVPYAAQAEAGNIILPHPALYPWVNAWIEEHAVFPKGAQDGRVDSGRQAVNYLTTAKHVWNKFSADNTHKLDIQWGQMHPRVTLHYGSMVQMKDLSVWFLESIWDDVEGKLFVYGCWTAPDANPVVQVPLIINRMQQRKYKTENILSNAAMWKEDARIKSVGSMYRREFTSVLRTVPVGLRESIMYDQMGAIAIGNQMFTRKQIYIAHECKEAARQIASWTVDKGKPKEEDSGYCLCLCQIISELRRRKLLVKKPGKKDYDTVVEKNFSRRC